MGLGVRYLLLAGGQPLYGRSLTEISASVAGGSPFRKWTKLIASSRPRPTRMQNAVQITTPAAMASAFVRTPLWPGLLEQSSGFKEESATGAPSNGILHAEISSRHEPVDSEPGRTPLETAEIPDRYSVGDSEPRRRVELAARRSLPCATGVAHKNFGSSGLSSPCWIGVLIPLYPPTKSRQTAPDHHLNAFRTVPHWQ